MKQPEFQRMFKEYVDEISNPDHRAEYEAYLAQLEREEEVPKNIELMRPEVWRHCRCRCCRYTCTTLIASVGLAPSLSARCGGAF